MAHIVILGAGLGGMPMAYEMKEQLRPGDRVTVVGNGPNFHFVPSNPWVAVNWPKLAFDEIEGLGPDGHTQSVCNVDHAQRAASAWDAFVKDPGPIVVGAVQGASCFGPAYEFAFIMETDLRSR